MKQNRTRTIVTVIGVLLSAALFTALFSFCTSLMDYLERTYSYRSGDYHISVQRVDDQLREACQEDEDTDKMSVSRYVGYAKLNTENDYKPYLYLEAADDVFFASMPVHLTAGRLPKSEQEILLPEHLNYNGAVSYQLGDRLTLELGDRRFDGAEEGEYLYQENPYTEELPENLKIREQKTYQVVGFYERPNFEDYSAPGYTALTYDGGREAYPAGSNLYIRLKHPGKTLESFQQRHHLDQYSGSLNWDLLRFSGTFQASNVSRVVFLFAIIFGILVMVGSVSLIYSAFAISVSERTRQFGLLSSIGAARRQIRRSVMWEAVLVSAIGIPLGLCVGLAGMGITFHFVGDKFQSLIESPYSVELHISWPAFLGAVAITILTVWISILVPSKRATRVTAIEAIRQSQDICPAKKEIRVSRLFYKIFGLEGLLGKKYFVRSKRRYRTTIASLSLSIILFISVSSYCNFLRTLVNANVSTANYDVVYRMPEKDEALLKELMQVKSAQQTVYSVTDTNLTAFETEDLTDEYKNVQKDVNGKDVGKDLVEDTLVRYYLDDSSYESFLRAQGLNPDKYLGKKLPPAIVCNQGTRIVWSEDGERNSYQYSFLKKGVSGLSLPVDGNVEKEGYQFYSFGIRETADGTMQCGYYYVPEDASLIYDEQGNADLSQAEFVPAKMEEIPVGDYVNEVPMGTSEDSGMLVLVYPMSALPEDFEPVIQCYFAAEDHEALVEEITEILQDHGLSSGEYSLQDQAAYEEADRNIITIVNVFSYGFIILISLIAVANVFNTLSTNIALRKRDFAMLCSIGMTQKGIRKMLRYECVLYGLRSLLIGIPAALAVSGCIFLVTTGALRGMLFRVPWPAILVSVICVFAVVFVTAMYAVRRLQRENIIEALKEENI